MPADSRDHRIVDELNGICRARILGLAVVVVIGYTSMFVEGDVLQYATKAQRIPDLRLILFRELDAFGVATTLKIEDAIGAPAVFIIADQIARRIRGECRLPRARKSEEQRAHAIVSDICRAMHRKHIALG